MTYMRQQLFLPSLVHAFNTHHVTGGQKLANTMVVAIFLVLIWFDFGFELVQITYLTWQLNFPAQVHAF